MYSRIGINSNAIGGYLKETKTMYINSKYDTAEKIKEYVNKTKGYFANSSEFSPYLHELGHKQYEDALAVYSEKNNISVDKARYMVENKLMEYVGEKRKNDKNYIINNLSIYANTSYTDHKYFELFAECISSSNSNECINDILKIINLKR